VSDLLDLQEKLQDTLSVLQSARNHLAADPADMEFSLVVLSLEQRQESLEHTFAAIAAASGIDVCKYRLMRSEESYPASAFADSIKTFQTVLTVFFDALRNGPKHRASSGAEIVRQTTLDVGYVYPGSLGIAFTIKNEQQLFSTELDNSMKEILSLVHVSTPDELVAYSRKLGPAPIRKVHEWAGANARFGMTIDIEWKHEDSSIVSTRIQPEEATRLTRLIEETKPDEVTPMEFVGTLVGGDTKKKNFHLTIPDAEDVEGYMGDEFTWEGGELLLDRRYKALVNRHVIVHLATEQEDTSWELVRLSHI
jgi:hypothetical protein